MVNLWSIGSIGHLVAAHHPRSTTHQVQVALSYLSGGPGFLITLKVSGNLFGTQGTEAAARRNHDDVPHPHRSPHQHTRPIGISKKKDPKKFIRHDPKSRQSVKVTSPRHTSTPRLMRPDCVVLSCSAMLLQCTVMHCNAL